MEMQSVKGMRDFYPDQMRRREWLFARFREAARRFNFVEYDACVLEHEELYIRKAGDEITEQLYSFQDKGGRRVALRPEITPSLPRMILARRHELGLPLRWFTVGQCFRYERAQRGRKREHFQWNADIVGRTGIAGELELLALLVDFFESVGLTERDVTIRFNNRKLLTEVLTRGGVPEARFAEVSVIIDKLDKIGSEKVSGMLIERGIDSSTAERIMSFINASGLEDLEAVLGYVPLAVSDVHDLLEGCMAYGIDRYLKFSPALVRGLSYYTGMVFEAFEISGESRSICGGGRYDRLFETSGGPPTPMVGFGLGDVVVSLILEEKGLFPASSGETKVLAACFSEAESIPAIRAARLLRKANIQTELDVSGSKLKKLFARAAREGFSHVVLAAPQEVKEGRVSVKDLGTGAQDAVPESAIVERIRGGYSDS